MPGEQSPLGKAAIGMAPDRVAPAVADGGALGDVVLVDLDAQARAVRDLHEAVVVGEHAADR